MSASVELLRDSVDPEDVAIFSGVVLIASIGLHMVVAPPKKHARAHKAPSRRLPLYIAATFLYGLFETTSGNWGELEMRRAFAAPEGAAAYALIAFWGALP